MNNVLGFDFIDEICEMLAAKGRPVDFRRYFNCHYLRLIVGGESIAEFNYNGKGLTSYAFNQNCYTAKQWKDLPKEKCVDKNDKEGWHSRTTGYYGRKICKDGYTIEDDKHYIRKCIKTYLVNIEEE